jgi:hypothetical protein
MSLNYAQSAKNYTRNCGALNQVKPTQKTTRTVCNQPLRKLLKNNFKAKITKNTNPTNSLHI